MNPELLFERDPINNPPNLHLIHCPTAAPDSLFGELFPDVPMVVTTDFVTIHNGTESPIYDFDNTLLGFSFPRVANIDHHANHPQMRRNVTATNLAIRLMHSRERIGLTGGIAAPVIITHTDCDSILSALILTGVLPPDEELFGKAAISADHTGEENPIADLLMSIEELRNVSVSTDALMRLLRGEHQVKNVQEYLDQRLHERELAYELVQSGTLEDIGNGIHFAHIQHRISGELVPSLLPDARVIVLASPLEEDSSRWEIRVRAGHQFPHGASLKDIGLEQFNWGGRWNAGNTRRSGGYLGDPFDIASTIRDYFTE